MRIIYIDVPNVSKKYPYYTDLYRSLCKISEVTLINRNFFNVKNVPDVKPDALIFGLGWMSQNDPKVYKIKGLKCLNVPIVCILHKPQNLLENKLNFCRANANLLVYSQKEHKEYGKRIGVPSIQSWMAGDPAVYKDRGVKKVYDFGFSGALHGGDKVKGNTRNLRVRVYNIVKDMKLNLFWNGSDSVAPRIKPIKEYAYKINQSKIWLTTTGPLEDISPRYFEIGLSKTLIFCNKMGNDTYGKVFRDGENCVMFENDLSDFVNKLRHYLRDEKERQIIIDNAYNEFLIAHTWDHRAKELVKAVQRLKNDI